MPILDKLNKKLDEAGVEERGRTIEEAVDLLPAMGGSGGMQFDILPVKVNVPVQWPEGGGGGSIQYFQIGKRDEKNRSLASISITGGGPTRSVNSSMKLSNVRVCVPVCDSRIILPSHLGVPIEIDGSGDIKFGASMENVTAVTAIAITVVQWLVDEEGNPLE